MKVKYLFTLAVYRKDPNNPDREIKIQESIVAETWLQALAYWHIEFIDENCRVEHIVRQEPVIKILPENTVIISS